MKKLGIILAAVLLIVTGAFFGARWYFFSRVPAHAQLLPANAALVITVKPQRLIYDMFRYGVRLDDSTLFPGFFSKLQSDSNNRRILSRLPIDFAASAYVFYASEEADKGYWAAVISLKANPDKLEAEALKQQDISLINRPNFTLGWKGKEAIVVFRDGYSSSQTGRIISLFNTRSNLPGQSKMLYASLKADGLITAWVKSKYFRETKTSTKIPAQINRGETYIVLNSLKDALKADLFTEIPVNTTHKDPGTPGILNYLQNQPIGILSNHLTDTVNTIATDWFGFPYSRLQVALSDTVNVVKEFIDYEYDDDFNQIPVIRKQQEVVPGLIALADIPDMAPLEARLKEKAQALDNTGLYYLVDGTFRVQLNRERKQVLFTNHTRRFEYAEKHAWLQLQEQLNKHSFYLRIQPERLSMYAPYLTANLDPDAQQSLAVLEAYIRYLEITGNEKADHFSLTLSMKGNQGYGALSFLRMLYVLTQDEL